MTATLPPNVTDMRLSDLLKVQGVTVIINVTTESTPPPVIMPPPPPTERMLRIEEVKEMTGLSRTTIYARIDEGKFPAPVRDGKRCSRWRLSDVQGYLQK